MDIFELMIEQQEPINITIGRLRGAIKQEKDINYQLELLDRISNKVMNLGIKYPEDLDIYK